VEEYRVELTANDEKITTSTKAEEYLLKFLRRYDFTEVFAKSQLHKKEEV